MFPSQMKRKYPVEIIEGKTLLLLLLQAQHHTEKFVL